ncbi:dTDP-4-dehydrorhamnose reductase [Sphingomonas sp.]
MFGRTGQLARAMAAAAADTATPLTALGRDDVDLNDLDAIDLAIRRHRPSHVVNAAAYTAVDRAETEPALAHAINADAPAAMARVCADIGCGFATVSTDFVFDGTASTPYRTDAPVAPLGVYGESKAEGERRVLCEHPGAIVLRTAWVHDADGRNFVTTMLRLMRERDEVRVVADQIGTPTAASSLAHALLDLVAAGAGGIHHFTDAGIASWYDLAVAVYDLGRANGVLTAPLRILPIATADYPTPARRPAYSVLDKNTTWPLLRSPVEHWRHRLASEMARAR